ncbi:hypothetical protein AtubIFM55763_001678 [Aspergillus tubingensis]|uniref:SnoaL-like domain family protein n=1 Tax=Aspergillus tubingensis TaxID=5068 RepID=UPI0015789F80|nr:SnoaL-like domain family protein [Aspergillus tubingensis]GFN16264.1 SnoaL-like domain family protein [Aspergillus tubingensis]GLA63880.1 hypothetical protein AtubIFM54640_005040 [Aspergillus tubingensis]GLA71308.1 hypothetical protein AtubIFM55763_001678 [Aspergillus tubingensis]
MPSLLTTLKSTLPLPLPIPQSWLQSPSRQTITLTTLTTLLLPLLYKNYKTYLSYGPGGAPYNLLGWFGVTFLLYPFGRNMTSTTIYEKKIANGETQSYLSEDTVDLLNALKREKRPAVGPHYVPQRQVEEFAGEEVKMYLDSQFYALAEQNPQLIKVADSRLELHAGAIFLATEELANRNETTRKLNGECVHVHRLKDYSLHMVLAPADCKKVFDAGWGQRHGFSGVEIPRALMGGKLIQLPSEYVLIYAPRTKEEVTLVLSLMKASLRYLTGEEVK